MSLRECIETSEKEGAENWQTRDGWQVNKMRLSIKMNPNASFYEFQPLLFHKMKKITNSNHIERNEYENVKKVENHLRNFCIFNWNLVCYVGAVSLQLFLVSVASSLHMRRTSK